MKTRLHKIISIFLVAVMLVTAAPLSGFVGLDLNFDWINLTTRASAATGTCGTNAIWTFDESTGELVISGTGEIQSFGSYSFRNSIKSVVIEDGITSIGNSSFSNCQNLSSVIIADSVTVIGYRAFAGCHSLLNVLIGNGVTTIDSYAFSSCGQLSKIYIPTSVMEIGVGALSTSSFGSEVYYEGSKEQWDQIAVGGNNRVWFYIYECFSERPYFDKSNYYDNFDWILYSDGELVINGIDEITSDLFSNVALWSNYIIKYITIGDSVTSIGENAFKNYNDLEVVTISEGVNSIGSGAFSGCDELKTITIPEGVTSLSSNLFLDCRSLSTITLHSNLESIGYGAFKNCTSLADIELPNSVKSIGGGAFYNTGYYNDPINWDVDSLYLGDFLIDIKENDSGVYAIKEGTKYIADSTFSGNANVTSVSIPNSVVFIGEHAFDNCDSLTNLEIPDSVTQLGSGLFYDCDNLIRVVIGNGVTYIADWSFYSCNQLTDVIIGDSVTYIGESAFQECWNLECIEIPGNVTTVKRQAFFCCNRLKSVSLGKGVASIEEGAFEFCYELKSIAIPLSVKNLEEAFVVDVNGYHGNGLTQMLYEGTETQWSKISGDKDGLEDILIFNCYSERPYHTGAACGENLTWKLYTDGELVIDGVGEIKSAPWDVYTVSGFPDVLTKITIGDGITKINERVFQYSTDYASELKIPISTKLPNNQYTFGSYFSFGKVTLTKGNGIAQNYSTTRYDDNYNYFAYTPWQNSVVIVIDEGVTEVGDYTFYGCSYLKSVTISQSVTNIGSYAFQNCSNLEEVHYTGSIEEWCNIVFEQESDKNMLYGAKLYINGTRYYLRDGVYSKSPVYAVADGDVTFGEMTDITIIVYGQPSKIRLETLSGGTNTFSPDSSAVKSIKENDDGTQTWKITIKTYEGTELYKVYAKFGSEWDENFCYLVLNPSSHIYGDWSITKMPTCYSTGLKQRVCLVCGEVDVREIEAVEHNFISYVFAPTCTEKGYTLHSCDYCGYEYIDSYIDATGHSYGEWVVTTQPSCTAKGEETSSCVSCGNIKTQEVPTKQHNYRKIIVDPTCTEEGNVIYYCRDCRFTYTAEILPATGHNEFWDVLVEPTCTHNGTKQSMCVDCGNIVGTSTIPATGFDHTDGVTIDFIINTISGFNAGETSLENYTTTINGYTWEYETQNGRLGTGSKATLKDGDTVIGEYTVLIFGDVNGDGWYDGTDSIIVSCLANGLLTQDSVSEAVYRAADCNHDGVIDSFDVALLEQAGLLLSGVDQSKSNEELATDEAFIEYLDLIDQTPEDEEVVEDEVIETPEVEEEFDFIEFIITIIKKFFDLLISYLPIK